MKNSTIAAIAGAGAVAFAVYIAKKCNDICAKLGKSLEEIDKATPVEVAQSAINEAVERAVKLRVDEAVRDVAKTAVDGIRSDITKEAKHEVELAYSDVRGDVKDALMRQIGDVNISRVREEVIDNAKKEAARKFDSDLQGVLNQYNDKLASTVKIYSSIANSMRGTRNTEVPW